MEEDRDFDDDLFLWRQLLSPFVEGLGVPLVQHPENVFVGGSVSRTESSVARCNPTISMQGCD